MELLGELPEGGKAGNFIFHGWRTGGGGTGGIMTCEGGDRGEFGI